MDEDRLPANTGESTAAVNEEAPKQNKGNTFFAKLFRPENRKKTVIGLVISVLLIAVVCFTLFYMSPRQVAIRYAKAAIQLDISSLARMSAYDYKTDFIFATLLSEDTFYKMMSDVYNEDIRSWEDFCKVAHRQQMESLEDSYGKYSLSIIVTKERDYSAKKYIAENKSVIEKYTAYGGFDADDIIDAKIIGVKVKLDGEDNKDTYVCTIAMCKVHGFWKVLDYKYN